jgi:hypothetical protein
MDKNQQGDLSNQQKTPNYQGKGRANNSLPCYTQDNQTRYRVIT